MLRASMARGQVLGEEKMQGTMGGEMVETGGNLASRERKGESLKGEGAEHDQQRPKSESRGEEREGVRAKEAISVSDKNSFNVELPSAISPERPQTPTRWRLCGFCRARRPHL